MGLQDIFSLLSKDSISSVSSIFEEDLRIFVLVSFRNRVEICTVHTNSARSFLNIKGVTSLKKGQTTQKF